MKEFCSGQFIETGEQRDFNKITLRLIFKKLNPVFAGFNFYMYLCKELLEMRKLSINSSYFILPHKHEKVYWKMGNGDLISVTNMDFGHIKNTLRCLEGQGKSRIKFPRAGKGKQAWKKVFQEELNIRRLSEIKSIES